MLMINFIFIFKKSNFNNIRNQGKLKFSINKKEIIRPCFKPGDDDVIEINL